VLLKYNQFQVLECIPLRIDDHAYDNTNTLTTIRPCALKRS